MTPCDDCFEREFYARVYDMHFYGEDCPVLCNAYRNYLKGLQKDDKRVGEDSPQSERLS